LNPTPGFKKGGAAQIEERKKLIDLNFSALRTHRVMPFHLLSSSD